MYIAPGGIINPITSGSITSGSIAPKAIVSGTVASGAIMGSLGGGPFNIASGTIGNTDIAAGTILTVNIASGAVQSGKVGSGAVLGSLGGGAFTIASGTIGTTDLGSGSVVRATQFVSPFYSGTSWTINTAENISGGRAVAIHPSGNVVWQAMASVSGRMPAIGVIFDNVLSGISANIYTQGFFTPSVSGIINFSGFVGKAIWVGRSGDLVTVSGISANGTLGAFASGDLGQKLGFAVNSGSIILNLNTTVWSGGPLGQITGVGGGLL